MFLICFFFLSVFTGLSFLQYSLYFTQSNVTVIDQAVWKLSVHHTPVVTIGPYAYESLFSHHAEFIYALIAYFYRFYPRVITLFILQHIFEILGSVGLYLILKQKGFLQRVSILLSFWYLSVYLWQQIVSGGIYSFDIAISFLIWMIYALKRRYFWTALVLAVLAMVTREESSVAVLIISGIFFIFQKNRLNFVPGAVALLYACFIFLFYFPFIMHTSFANDLFITIADSFTKGPAMTFNSLAERRNESDQLNLFIKQIPGNNVIASQNNLTAHLSHRDVNIINPGMNTFSYGSPCGLDTCLWFSFEGNPGYVFVDTSSVWESSDVGMPRETFIAALQNMEKTGYLHVYMKKGNMVVYALHPVLLGDGLMASYFPNRFLSGNANSIRVDPYINFNWVGQENFSVRWTGFIVPKYSQVYTFYVIRDDGVRLWVNNQLLIDRWFDHAATEYSIPIALTAGVKVPIKIEYYQHLGKAVMELGWSSLSTTKEIIPQSQLFSH